MTVLPDGDNLISDFKSWNAKAIYFYDADHNIMEFISRKGLALDSEEPFSANSIVSIGEMGIVTTHIEVIYDALNKMRPIPIFSGDFSRFCALGNDEGLFIVIDKNEKGWHPTQEEAFESDFIINGDYNFHFENGKIKELL